MDASALVVVGLVVATAVVALLVRRARSRSSDRADPTATTEQPPSRSGPTVIQPSRIVVVGGPRPDPDLAVRRAGRPGRSADPRRRILRDAAAVLVVGSLGVVAFLNLPAVGGTSGGVLSATGSPVPAAARPAPAPASDPPAAALPSSAPASEESGGLAASPAIGASAGSSPAELLPTPGATPSVPSLALLAPCPGRPDCYVYVVRRGDNVTLISRLFGISTETILRLNPSITDPSLIVTGERLTLPTPTR